MAKVTGKGKGSSGHPRRESSDITGKSVGKAFTRRQFLKITAVGAAGLGAAAVGLGKVVPAGAGGFDDAEGGSSLIGAVRLIPERSYVGVPELLEKYIKGDVTTWDQIKGKIDYTYSCLGDALWPVLLMGGLKGEIQGEVKRGKQLFFKINALTPEVLSLIGDGSPSSNITAATDWSFVAALMRFLHDKLSIRYYQMAAGEAGSLVPPYSSLLDCTAEALLEGTPFGADAGFWGGWPFYFVRKYLQECGHASDDDPMNGYTDSITGNYVSPGDARRQKKLIVYDLNHAEWFDRGRRVPVPGGGDNYGQVILHKALVGDPADPAKYPGSVLVNCPILKVHPITVITSAIKNLGMGGWPMCAGKDSKSTTPDWLYGYPPDHPPGLKGGVPGYKGGVYHTRWSVMDADEEGMPLRISDTPNLGLDGTMVDMNLAIKSQVTHTLHVVDAVKVTDINHALAGVPREEGLIFASKDPVALDLLCARYMFKNVPRDPGSPDRFVRGTPLPRYSAGAIVTDPGLDSRLSRTTLFDYAAGRGLGRIKYYVLGVDKTDRFPVPLISKDGHLGRIYGGTFQDVITRQFYFHQQATLWHMQPTVLAYAQATDSLSGSNYYGEFLALDEDGNGVIDDREFGRQGMIDCGVAVWAIAAHLIGKGEVEHGGFFMYSRFLKYAHPNWNTGGVNSLKLYLDEMAAAVGLQLAYGPEATDLFFGIRYGMGADGMPKWPSLQFARYALDLSLIYDNLYASAQAKKIAFTLYVPASVPYFPYAGYNPYNVPYVVATNDPTKIFTAEFADGEVW